MATKKITTKKKVSKSKSINSIPNDKWQAYWDEIGVDNEPDIDVPLHARGGQWKWNFENKVSLTDKITWVLTVVNVAILITLIIENY